MNNKKLTKKDFLKTIFSDFSTFINEVFNEELESFQATFPELIRPPGAEKEELFQQLCKRCKACVNACPYNALQATLAVNEFDKDTPSLNIKASFCRFCTNYPCVKACKSGALNLNNTKTKKIATAKIQTSLCIRANNINCTNCIDICNKTFKAINLFTQPNLSKQLPKINPALCTGCGACLTVCPVENAIKLKAVT